MGSLCMLQLTQKFFASSSMCSLRLLVDDGAGASLAMPDLFSSSPGLAEHFDHQSPEEGEHVASNVPNRTVLTLLGAQLYAPCARAPGPAGASAAPCLDALMASADTAAPDGPAGSDDPLAREKLEEAKSSLQLAGSSAPRLGERPPSVPQTARATPSQNSARLTDIQRKRSELVKRRSGVRNWNERSPEGGRSGEE